MKLEMVPPVAIRSSAVKSVEASERVKESVAVSAALRVETLVAIATVGRRVSTLRVMVLLVSAPSLLVLPAASEKVPEAMEMMPSAVLPAAGV